MNTKMKDTCSKQCISPGIKGSTPLHVDGLSPDFSAQWRMGQTHFPCGVDFFFTHGQTFLGLPRSTLIEG